MVAVARPPVSVPAPQPPDAPDDPIAWLLSLSDDLLAAPIAVATALPGALVAPSEPDDVLAEDNPTWLYQLTYGTGG